MLQMPILHQLSYNKSNIALSTIILRNKYSQHFEHRPLKVSFLFFGNSSVYVIWPQILNNFSLVHESFSILII